MGWENGDGARRRKPRMALMRGVLWDLDGVLVSTGEFHFEAWSRTLSERGIPFSHEQFRTTFGMNNTGVLTAILGHTPAPSLLSELSETKERLFREMINGLALPLPGVLEWLTRLQDWGIRQAIASSAPPANIDALVDELKLRAFFQAIVSGYDLPGKPEPAVFIKAANLIGVESEQCVVVEDAVAGVEAAKRAGMKCIAVTTTNPADELRDADLVVDRLDNLSAGDFSRLL